MRNKTKLLIPLFFILIFVLLGYTTKSNNVLSYFKKMKVSDVNYCEYQFDEPGKQLIKKRLDKKELVALIALLNKSKDAFEGKFPTSKGGFVGLNLYMKSGKIFSFNNLSNGFWTDFGNKRYKIVQPNYEAFFRIINKKYFK